MPIRGGPAPKRHATTHTSNKELSTNEAIAFNAVGQKPESYNAAAERQGRDAVGSLAQPCAFTYAAQYLLVPAITVETIEFDSASYKAQYPQLEV